MLYYGGDYNPEQWPEPVMGEDIALMRRAGVNLVSVGVFSWSRLEPVEGRYRFDWLDRVLDRLHAAGIGVALATPTASPPPWFGRAYPDALAVTAQGVRLTHGSRDTYCISAPAYRCASTRIAGELAARYGGHPALVLWHVHNEYGTGCYCDHAATAFGDWLVHRYGTVERLNEAWTASFWSQEYDDWRDVLPPRATQYLPNPTQSLDWRRFLSDELLSHFIAQRDLLRQRSPGIPVTTNFAFGGWVPVNGWQWAAEEDLVAIDCYPDATGPAGAEQVAFAADLARSLAAAGSDAATAGADPGAGAKPWLLMEQAANLVYTRGRMLARAPGELARHTLSHLARGSIGAMHFQWRAAPGGAEMWHAAMLPPAGPDTRAFRETVEVGTLVAQLSEVDGKVVAPAAIVWDPEAWWAMQAPGLPSSDVDYHREVSRVHAALYRAGITADFAQPGADLSGYRLVLVPALYLLDAAGARAIGEYVHSGGTLVVGYFSALVDADLRVHPGGLCSLHDLLGIRIEEFRPMPPGSTVALSDGATVSTWRETVHLAGAVAEATYADDGGPAITRHGRAWYLSGQLDPLSLQRLLARIAIDAGIDAATAPDGVEVIRRGDWLVAINHTDQPAEVPATGIDLLTGDAVTGQLALPAGGVAAVHLNPPA
jgi:beta-galactosidase